MCIEFDAVIVDGHIQVPPEIAAHFTGKVHVVISPVLADGDGPSIIDELLANPMNIEGFKPIPRDDIYDRKSGAGPDE